MSERLGLWTEYVQSLKIMTPYQAAAARRSYTKCNKWFLDIVDDLDEETLNVLNNGGFVIWRSDHAYGAVSPDLNTEQTMMAGIKEDQVSVYHLILKPLMLQFFANLKVFTIKLCCE